MKNKKHVCEVKLYRIRKSGKDYYITCCSDNPVIVKLKFAFDESEEEEEYDL